MPSPRRRPRAVTRPVTLESTMSERQWALIVEGLLAFYGWRYHHSPDNRPTASGGRQRVGDRGFPDYCATRRLPGRGPELAFLELKADAGRLGPGQADWLEALEAVAEEAGTAEVLDGDDVDAYPRVIVGVYRPRQRRELEELLAGPGGRNVYLGRDLLPS